MRHSVDHGDLEALSASNCKQDRIPGRIIQTGKTARLSMKERAAVCNLKLLNPDFEYLFFDDQQVEDFFDKEFPQYRPLIEGFRFRIQRYDFFRYLAIYRYGGFYFDLDVLLVSSLSSLLDSRCVFAFEGLTIDRYLRDQYGMDWYIGNYGFGASPGHPFLEAIIENCVRAQRDPRWAEPAIRGMPWLSRSEFLVLCTTGPGLVSRTLAENPSLAASVNILFPSDVCEPSNWNCFGDFGIHLMEGTWRRRQGFLHRRLAQYCERVAFRRLLRKSVQLGKTRRV